MALDKINAMAAPPGHSLTGPPGKWPWESPPQIVDPEMAIDFIIEKLEDKPVKDDMISMMGAGITVQELVAQISFKGFMEGYFSPDVAELIKPAIGIHLYKEATDAGIDVQMFVDPEEEGEQTGEVDDVAFFEIMKQRNPELFSAIIEMTNQQQRMDTERVIKMNSAQERRAVPERPNTESFLTVGDM